MMKKIIKMFTVGVFLFIGGLFIPSAVFAWTTTATFEDLSIDSNAAGSTGWAWAGSATYVEGTTVHGGSKSSRMEWPVDNDGWATCQGNPSVSEETSGAEVWYRAYHYFPANWQWADTHKKHMRLHIANSNGDNQGWISIILLDSGELELSNEIDPLTAENAALGVNAPLGEWAHYEIYTYLHETEGIIRIWLNGVLVGEQLNCKTLNVATDKLDSAIFASYWNDPRSPQVQSEYIDDVIITTDQPVNTDMAGNYMIGPDGWQENNNYHVATTGNDVTGDGSIGNPYRTPEYGAKQLSPGDTLLIHNGTYTLSVSNLPVGDQNLDRGRAFVSPPYNVDGTLSEPFTIKAYGDGIVLLDAGASPEYPAIGSNYGDYVIVDGVSVRGAAICMWANHCVIKNSDLYGGIDCPESNGGDNFGCVLRVEGSTGTTIINNTLHDNQIGITQENSPLIMVYNSTDLTITKNDIFNSVGIGVRLKDEPNNVTTSYNYIYDNVLSGFQSSNQVQGHNVHIHHNVFRNNNTSNNTSAGALHTNILVSNWEIYNNTFVNNHYADIRGTSTTGIDDIAVWNNLFVSADSYYRLGWSSSGPTLADDFTYSDYNSFTGGADWREWATTWSDLATYQANNGSGFDSDSVSTSPNFINSAGSLSADYKRTSYPVDGRGGAYESVMGAYTTDAEVIGHFSDGGGAICDSTHLSLCTTDTTCTNAGGHFCNSICQVTVCDLCKDQVTLTGLTNCLKSHMPGSASEGFIIPTGQNITDYRTLTTAALGGTCDDTIIPNGLSSIYTAWPMDKYCVISEKQMLNGWGTLIINTIPAKQISIQAPHPKYDTNTLEQAAAIFEEIEAHTLVIAGAHRNSNAIDGCQSGYKISDVSHNVDNFFHVVTEEIINNTSDTVIQFHGMSASSCSGVDAYITHGVSTIPVVTDKATKIRNAFRALDGSVTINIPGDAPTCSLNATKNTVGRFINDSANACTTSAINYNGRFIHIEQKIALRNSTQYANWSEAIRRAYSVTRADVDQSSSINSTDALLTLRNSLGLEMSGTNWQSSSTTGDVNCDGGSNSNDVLLVLRESLGLDVREMGWCVD